MGFSHFYRGDFTVNNYRIPIISALRQLGIRIHGKKVNKGDLRAIFGAKYKEPEWMLLHDYKLDVPRSYTDTIDVEEKKLGRIILPTSYIICPFGKFLNEQGNPLDVIGMVYQYSLKSNPRNIHFAFRLFLGETTVNKNAGITTLFAAKEECISEAKKIIETKLFDLN